MFRFLLSIALFAFLVTGCLNVSGDAESPVTSGSLDTTEAGRAALLIGPLNPQICEAVLASPPSTHTLELQALTETVQDGDPQIDSMCAAIYETSAVDGSFLTVALVQFDSGAPAIARYDLLRAALIALDHLVSEINNADDGLLDWFSAGIDADGIGRTTVLRLKSWVISISTGPTNAESPWNRDDLLLIGESIVRRGQ